MQQDLNALIWFEPMQKRGDILMANFIKKLQYHEEGNECEQSVGGRYGQGEMIYKQRLLLLEILLR